MNGMLAQWLSSQKARRTVEIGFVSIIAILLITFVVLMIQLVPIWVTDWQGGHGYYPTGHLTYSVPERWNTTTLTGLNPTGNVVWWDDFDDRVVLTSHTYPWTPADGAEVAIESVTSRGQSTIGAWYESWEVAVTHRLGSGVVLPLADFTHVNVGGQTALCAASEAGSQMLPPHVPPSPHFDTTFAGYTPPYIGQAVVMCFTLWHVRAYYVEITVQLHTATREADLRDAARIFDSLHFV